MSFRPVFLIYLIALLLPLEALATVKPSPSPRAAVIINEIAWENDRLEIHSDAPLNPKVLTLGHPNRVVVDLLDAELADPSLAQTLRVRSGAIGQIRIAQHPNGYLRVVFDCKRPAIIQILQPKEKNKNILLIQESELSRLAEASPTPAPTATPIKRRIQPRVTKSPVTLPLAFGPKKTFHIPLPAPSLVPAHIDLIPARSTAAHPLALSLDFHGGKTSLSLKPTRKSRSLSYQLSRSFSPPRLSIRIPRASIEGPLPDPRGEALELGYRLEGEDLVCEVGLPDGPFQVEEENKGGLFTVTWKAQPRPKSMPLVVIDPGHGGTDPGAVGPNGLRESQVNLEMAMQLKEELRKLNIDSVLTRTEDIFIDLAPRPNFAEGKGAKMLVSLHCNSYPGNEATGAETYYRQDGSIPLAKTLHRALIEDLGRPDRGVRQARLYVLRSQLLPSVLLETAFISNPNEEALLKDPDFQRQAARAIAGGIWQYLNAPSPETASQVKRKE